MGKFAHSSIKGVAEVAAALRAQSVSGAKTLEGRVQYTAPYAVYVHENLQARHTNGQAKYLEQPARQYEKEIGEIVQKNLSKKKSLFDGLWEAMNFLLAKSQELVPVDTGFLKSSGEVVIEN